MGIDYYSILGISRNSDDLAIKKAFRRQALKFNPQRIFSSTLPSNVKENFALVTESYDVLSDALHRAVYDQYGEEGLKEGVPAPAGFIQPYTYHGDPAKTYRDFFGTDSPYADLLDIAGQPLGIFSGPEGKGIKQKSPPVEKVLLLTLEEVYSGCIKKMLICPKVLTSDGETTESRDRVLTLPVAPGTVPGTRFTFKDMGDQGPNNYPGDIVFVSQDEAHHRFTRRGADLIAVAEVPLKKALTGCLVTVDTLDGRTLHVPVNDIITKDYEKVVVGEGLPRCRWPRTRGNLVLRFNIIFPERLTSRQKKMITQALP